MPNAIVSAYRSKFPNDTRSDDELTLEIGRAYPEYGWGLRTASGGQRDQGIQQHAGINPRGIRIGGAHRWNLLGARRGVRTDAPGDGTRWTGDGDQPGRRGVLTRAGSGS